MIQVYGIKSCGSVKKALTFFATHNLEYTFHDFKKEKPSEEKIASWLWHVDMKKLLNTQGTTYKKLNLKALDLDNASKQEWLYKENLLIKRPVVEFGEKVLVGFDEEIYKGVFL